MGTGILSILLCAFRGKEKLRLVMILMGSITTKPNLSISLSVAGIGWPKLFAADNTGALVPKYGTLWFLNGTLDPGTGIVGNFLYVEVEGCCFCAGLLYEVPGVVDGKLTEVGIPFRKGAA